MIAGANTLLVVIAFILLAVLLYLVWSNSKK